jgi:hypothetical protein
VSRRFAPQHRRVDRAEKLGAELGESIQRWATLVPNGGMHATIAEDRHSWKLHLAVPTPPPIDDWVGAFADAVHNLRSALDNLVVALADEQGIEDPKVRKQLAFPICVTAKDWKAGEKRIASLNEASRQAIEEVQPLDSDLRDLGGKSNPLRVLSALDNLDKHHVQVVPDINPQELMQDFRVEFVSEADAAASVPPQVELSLPPLLDGGLLLRQTTAGKIARVSGGFNFRAQVQVQDSELGWIGLTFTLAWLCHNTRTVIDHIASRTTEPS